MPDHQLWPLIGRFFITALFGLVLVIGTVSFSRAQPDPLSDATETDAELIDGWKESDSLCGRPGSRDVSVYAACVSRAIYGRALNERGVCLGQRAESNAQMRWHRCGPESLRFPAFDLPDISWW